MDFMGKILRLNYKNYIKAMVLPAVVLIFVLILMGMNDQVFLGTSGQRLSFTRSITTVFLTTIALSINLSSGRFDFSIGAISLLSSVISAKIAMAFNLPVEMMLIVSIIAGCVLGIISATVYIISKLPPIIVSLGVTLIFEGFAYFITKGYGVSFVTDRELTSFGSIINYSIIIVVVLALIILIFDYTKYGYEYKALQGGQKVAVHTGINEKKNAVISYAISGTLMGIVGFISASNIGTIQMTLNFGSIAIMFTAFLPMFIGGFLSRFCNLIFGYLIGAVIVALITISFIQLDVDASIQQIVLALALVGFLIYLNNEEKITQWTKIRSKQERKQ